MAAASLSYPSVSTSQPPSFVRAIGSHTDLFLPIVASPKSPSQRFPSIVVVSNGRRDRGVAITESERRMLVERFGFDPSDIVDEQPSRQKSRTGGENGKARKGKWGAPPPKEPTPPRTTHRLLQVLGGKVRRRKLLSPQGMDVRPMMEVVKGATFDILQAAGGSPASLSPGRWLDLYSGTGSVGIEALSRGCSKVHFVEMDPWVVSEVLRPNLECTGFLDASVIHTTRVENFLEQGKKFLDGSSFDYISVTPPYTAVDYSVLMGQLSKSPLVGDDGFIVVEYPLKTDLPGSCGHLIKIANRRFGRTNLAIYGPTWAKKKRKSEMPVETIAQKVSS